MADINLSIKVVSTDGGTRTVDLSQGGALAVKAGDRLILFGPDADKATLVRSGDNLALMIDGQRFFVLDGYYALEGDQAAEIITDPAVAATFLTAAEGGLPLLTTPPTETAGPAPAETDTPQVDLVQATAPTLPGDNASAKSWQTDDDILLDDPTYRPIEITYDVEDELIIEAAAAIPPTPTTPTTEAVNLPPYFTTVTVEVDEQGNVTTATANADEPVDEFNFQQYELVAAYQVMLPGPHPMDVAGDGAAGYPYYSPSGGGLPPTDVSESNGSIIGWGYIPFHELGYIGVADPENDPLTVAWVNGLNEFEIAAPGWQVWVSASLGTDLGDYDGESALYLLVPTDAAGDPIWENVFEVWSGVWDPAFPEGFNPSYYDYDGVDGIADLYGVSDHFSTIITVADPFHAPVEAQVNLDILDVNEAPEFQNGVEEGPYDYYQFNPWGPENLDPANSPDTAHDANYEVYVGSVYALDPDYLDQLYGQVFYNFFDGINYSAEDPFNPGVADTAGWRPDSWEVYTSDGLLYINSETGDIWLDIDLLQSWADGDIEFPEGQFHEGVYHGTIAAHDMVDRFGEITDGDGEVVYDDDRIFSDLWDLAYMYIEGDQAPVLYEIADIHESMQTTTDTLIQEGGVWIIDQAEAIMSQGYFVLQADDPDGTDVSFATGDDAYGDTALFNVMEVGGQWRLYFDTSVMPIENLDFETKSSFDVELVLNDGFLNFTEQVTVNLINANETPWFENTSDVDSLPEVASTGTIVAWLDAGDYDVPENLDFNLLTDATSPFNPNDYFEIALQGSQWVVLIRSGADLADLLGDVTFKVSLQDDGGETSGELLADLYTVSFEVTAVDQSVDENYGHAPWAGMSGDYPTGHGDGDTGDGLPYGYDGDTSYTYDGNFDDPANWSFTFEADADTYSLGGDDAAFFDLTWDSATNTYTLAFKPTVLSGSATEKLDYEALGSNTVLDVEVSSSTSGDPFYDLNVEVNNVNESPHDLEFDFGDNEHEGDHVGLSESTAGGSFVAQVTFLDEDDPDAATNHLSFSANDTYHYVLDDASGLFTISDSGEITLAAGANLDYELADSYDLTVYVYDSSLNGSVGYGPLSGQADITVDVFDTEREPEALSATVDENTGHVPWGDMTQGDTLPTGHGDSDSLGANAYGYADGDNYAYDGDYNGPAQWLFEFTTEGDKDDYDITGVSVAGDYFDTSDFTLVNTGTGVAVQFADPASVVLNYEGTPPNSFSLTIEGIDAAHDSSAAYPNDEINDVTYTINVDVNDVNETPYDLHFTGSLVNSQHNAVDTTEALATGSLLADTEEMDEDDAVAETYHYWFWIDGGSEDGEVQADELYSTILTGAEGEALFSMDEDDGEIWVNGVLDFEALGDEWTVTSGSGTENDPYIASTELNVVVFDSSEGGLGYGPLHTTGTLTVNIADEHTTYTDHSGVDENLGHVPWGSYTGGDTLPDWDGDYTYNGHYTDPDQWNWIIPNSSGRATTDYELSDEYGGFAFDLVSTASGVEVVFVDPLFDYEQMFGEGGTEEQNAFGFTVTGIPSDINDVSYQVQIDLNNVNETPYDLAPANATETLTENYQDYNTAIGSVSFLDEDDTGLDDDTYHYVLVDDFGLFEINGDGEIFVRDGAALDYEVTPGLAGGGRGYELTIRVFDSSLNDTVGYGALYDETTMTVEVEDEHDTQTHTFYIDETVGDFPWDDNGFTDWTTGHDGSGANTSTYGYEGQATYDYDGTLTPDYTDPDGPVYLDPAKFKYDVTSNGDTNESHYDLVTGGPFELWSDSSGVYVVWNGTDLDYETDPQSYTFTVTGNHADTNDVEHQVTVNLEDVNETPTAQWSYYDGQDPIPESVNGPYNVGIIYVNDPDTYAASETFHYELSGVGSEFFEVVPNIDGGVVRLKAGANLDYEQADSYTLGYTVWDSSMDGQEGYGPLSTTGEFTINIANDEFETDPQWADVDETDGHVPWASMTQGETLPTGHDVSGTGVDAYGYTDGGTYAYDGAYNGPTAYNETTGEGWVYKFTDVGRKDDYQITGADPSIGGYFELVDVYGGGVGISFANPSSASFDYETMLGSPMLFVDGKDSATDPTIDGPTSFYNPEINDAHYTIGIRVNNVNETPYDAGFDGDIGGKTLDFSEMDSPANPIATMTFSDEDTDGVTTTDTYHYWFWVDGGTMDGEVQADELFASLEGGLFTINQSTGDILLNGNLDYEQLIDWNVVDSDTKSLDLTSVVIDSSLDGTVGYGPLHDYATLTVRVDDESWHEDLTTSVDENYNQWFMPWEDTIQNGDMLPTGHSVGDEVAYTGGYNGPEQWAYKFTEYGTAADYTLEGFDSQDFGLRNAAGGGVEVYFLSPELIHWNYEFDAGGNPVYEFTINGVGDGAFAGDTSYEYDDVSYGITVNLENVNETPYDLHFDAAGGQTVSANVAEIDENHTGAFAQTDFTDEDELTPINDDYHYWFWTDLNDDLEVQANELTDTWMIDVNNNPIFTININNGEISVSGILDYEALTGPAWTEDTGAKSTDLQVVVFDSGDGTVGYGPLHTTGTLTVDVADEHEYEPMYTEVDENAGHVPWGAYTPGQTLPTGHVQGNVGYGDYDYTGATYSYDGNYNGPDTWYWVIPDSTGRVAMDYQLAGVNHGMFILDDSGSDVRVVFTGDPSLDFEGMGGTSSDDPELYFTITGMPHDINDLTYDVTVYVQNVNETPYGLTLNTTSQTIAENYDDYGTRIAWVADWSDEDLHGPNDIYHYVLEGGDGKFEINQYGEIFVVNNTELDYEGSPNSWDLTVKLFDSSLYGDVGYGPLYDEANITINLSDEQSTTPVVASVDEYISTVPWGSPTYGDPANPVGDDMPTGHEAGGANSSTWGYEGQTEYDYAGNYEDPILWSYIITTGDENDFTWGGADLGYFIIEDGAADDGQVTVKLDASQLDYETLANLTNTALDLTADALTTAEDNDTDYTFEVTVNNVNEHPVIAGLAEVSGTQADVNTSTATATFLDEEGGDFLELQFTDEDENNGGVLVDPATATDEYHFVLDDATGLFSINADGMISALNLDYDSLGTGWVFSDTDNDRVNDTATATLTAYVYDSSLNGDIGYGPLRDSQTITVKVQDVTEHEPVYDSVDENWSGAESTLVPWAAMSGDYLTGHPDGYTGSTGAYDPNAETYTYGNGWNDPLAWSYTFADGVADYAALSGQDAAYFELVEEAGHAVLSFKDNVQLDYESLLASEFVLDVSVSPLATATDNDTVYDFHITVNNVNESPYDVGFGSTADATVVSDEVDVTEGFDGDLAQVNFSDEDDATLTNDTYHYWFWNDDGDGILEVGEIDDQTMGGLFSINTETGEISTTGPIDYEALVSGWTEVDGGGNPDSKWAELDVAVFDSSLDSSVGYGPLNDTASLKVTVTDSGPTVTDPTNATYDEEALANGNHGESYPGATGTDADMLDGAVDPTGTLGITWGAAGEHGSDPLDINLDTTGLFTADGLAVTWYETASGIHNANTAYDSNDNEVFRLDINSTNYTYTYVQSQALFHNDTPVEDDLVLNFNFTARDSNNDTADGSFTVTVDDDAPVAGDDAVTVSGSTQPPLNIHFIIDVSGSMGWDTPTRLSEAQDALNHLMDEYAAVGVNVQMTLTSFSDGYADLGTYDLTDSGQLSSAHTAVNNLTPQGGTNYSSVLNYMQGELAIDLVDPTLTGYEHMVYFLSDGEPNTGLEAPASWQTYVDGAGIEVLALGIGDTSSFVGLDAVENNGDDPIIVTDPNDLDAVLISTIPSTVSGDVTSNDSFGADGPGGLVSFTYDGDTHTATVAPGGSTTVSTEAGGTLTVYSDGTWDYTAPNDYSGEDGFTYTIEDADHDYISAFQSIEVIDDNPEILTLTGVSVDEEGLAGGNIDDGYPGDLPGAAVTATGTIDIDYGDDGAHASSPLTLSAAGATWTAGTMTLEADDGSWEIVVNGNDTYTFTLNNALDHTVVALEDDLSINVSVTAKDADGDTANGSFTVTVDDDGPIANDDLVVTEGTNLAPINLYFITDVSGSMGYSIPSSGGGTTTGLAIAQQSLNHLLDEYANLGVDVRVTLLTFSSGYTDQGTFDITGGELQDAHDEVNTWYANGGTNFYNVLDYTQDKLTTDLNNANLDGYTNLVYFLSDGNPNSNSGAPSDWQPFIDNNGIEAIALGMGSNINTLNLVPVENAGDTPITVTDPNDLGAVLLSTVPDPISGDVLANDSLGADGFGEITSFTYTDEYGGSQTVYTVDGTPVTTEYGGELVVNSDGTWTYTPAANFEGEDSFEYALTDGDGDPDTATQTIQIVDDHPPVEAVMFQSADDEDFLGWSVSDLGDVNGDGFYDYIIGAYGDSEGGNYAGAAYVVFGDADVRDWTSPVSLDALNGTDGFKIIGSGAGDWAGYSVANAGDVNGDGYMDILVGAPGADGAEGGPDVWTPGNSNPFSDDLASDAQPNADPGYGGSNTDFVISNYITDINGNWVSATIEGIEGWWDVPVTWNSDSYFGVAGYYDDNDNQIDGNGNYSEQLIVTFGGMVNLTGLTVANMQSNDDGYAVLHVEAGTGDGGGDTVTVDIDGNGTTDIDFSDLGLEDSYNVTQVDFFTDGDGNDGYGVAGFIGGGYLTEGSTTPIAGGGSTYLIYGHAGGFGAELDLSNLEGGDGSGFKIVGQDGESGYLVHGIGNFNGDAYSDMIIGAPSASGTGFLGAAYAVMGAASMPAVNTLDELIAGGQAIKLTPSADGESGYSVGTADVNNDNVSEILIGSPLADLGAGDEHGTVHITNFDGSIDITLQGQNGDQAGWSVSGAGDIDGDGYEDVIIGAPGYDDGADANAGAAYVVYGGYLQANTTATIDLESLVSSGDALKIVGASAGDKLGTSVSAAGDVNGDGIDDVIVGAPDADNSDSDIDAGEAVIIFGSDQGDLGGTDSVIDVADLLDGVNGDEDDGAGVVFEGADAGDHFGSSVSGAGDVNADNNPVDDGGDDVLVGAEGANSGDGEAYLLLGTADMGVDQVVDVEEVVTT